MFGSYLRGELLHRTRQAVLVALGLALGVGLVITVSAASAGVRTAQSDVLSAMYGVGTDVTVTGHAFTAQTSNCVDGGQECHVGTGSTGGELKNGPTGGPTASSSAGVQSKSGSTGVRPSEGQSLRVTPGGDEICTNSHCVSAAGHTYDELYPPLAEPFSAAAAADVARLHDVQAATGVLTLVDQAFTFPSDSSGVPQAVLCSVDGVEPGPLSVGPLSGATITSGRTFSAADHDADVALADSAYAASNNLKVGSIITIRQVRFTVIGIVSQPQGTSPPDVYIPLARAQALGTEGKGTGPSLANEVNLIYVTAASAADIPAVQREISSLLPRETVTAPGGLAKEITGSLADADKLTNELGTWVSVLALVAAFAVACLLTMAAVARRSREFGTLKALGWRSRRIIAQVLGESLTMGVAGAAAGVGLGFAGASIIAAAAPVLSATDPSAIGSMEESLQNGTATGVVWRPVSVPLSPAVTLGVIVLAVLLAIFGSLLAGSFGSWQAVRLQPADALRRVE
jgi:putative ABC transport system permease protein